MEVKASRCALFAVRLNCRICGKSGITHIAASSEEALADMIGSVYEYKVVASVPSHLTEERLRAQLKYQPRVCACGRGKKG